MKFGFNRMEHLLYLKGDLCYDRVQVDCGEEAGGSIFLPRIRRTMTCCFISKWSRRQDRYGRRKEYPDIDSESR